jgi:hypothetical protein
MPLTWSGVDGAGSRLPDGGQEKMDKEREREMQSGCAESSAGLERITKAS